MREKDKTGEQLRNELAALRQRIAELEAAETRCQQAEELFKALFSSSTSGAYIIQDGKLQVINSAYQKITGYSTDELLGADPSPLVPAEDRSAVRENFIAILKGKRFSPCEHRFVNKAGEVGWVVETVIPIQYQGRRAVLGNFMDRDVTERKRQEQQLAFRATHDLLTGLPNRRLFIDRLALALVQARRHQQKVTVMMLDLDRFKDINDTLGHDVGDQLLQSVGNRLISLLRKSDTIARLGGDEFMLLLPEISGGKDTARIARKVLEDFHQPFVFGDRNIHITTSIGIALYPDHGEDSDTLMKKADIALYHAKELGRNNYQCCPEAMPPQALE